MVGISASKISPRSAVTQSGVVADSAIRRVWRILGNGVDPVAYELYIDQLKEDDNAGR